MTVGELIALLCKQASDDDTYLMAKDVYSISIYDDEISLYFTDRDIRNYSINRNGVRSESEDYEE